MLSRWLRWLVVTPVLLFVFGAILLSCSGSSSSGSPTPSTTPGFALKAIVISTGAPPSPTATMTPTPKHTKTVTPTLTPRASATSTSISAGQACRPAGRSRSMRSARSNEENPNQARGHNHGAATLWTSTDNSVFQSPPTPAQGGTYTTGFAGCVCILASSSGVSSQFVSVGVYEDVNNPAGGKNCVPSVPFVCPIPGERQARRRRRPSQRLHRRVVQAS